MIACLRLPYFAAHIENRKHAGADSTPLIIAQYSSGRAKVAAVCAAAEQAGIERGMALSRARALCPDARVQTAVPSRYRQTLQEVLALLSDYSQWIDHERFFTQTAVLYLDLGKLKPSVGQQLAADMQQRLHQEYGLSATIGLAAHKFAAYAATRGDDTEGIKLVPRGEEAGFLAPLPVALLPLDAENRRRLQLFGLHTMGQIARLPRSSMIAQFGRTGGTLHRLAAGDDPRRVARYVPEQTAAESFVFDPPIADRLVLDHVLRHLSQRLAAVLEAENRNCQEVTLVLSLENQVQLEEMIRLPEQKSGFLALHRAAQGLLQRMVIQSSVSRIEVRLARLAVILPRQLSLFDEPAPQKLYDVLLGLAAHYGADRFYTATLNPRTSLLPELHVSLEGIDVA